MIFLGTEFTISQFPRLQLYKSILTHWRDFWFFGSGGFGVVREIFLESKMNELIYANFEVSIKKISDSGEILFHPSMIKEIEEFKNLSIPSVPLTIFVELGVFGLILYILIFFIPTYQFKKNNSVLIFVLILLVIFFIQLFDVSLFRFHPLSFFVAFILGVINNLNFKY